MLNILLIQLAYLSFNEYSSQAVLEVDHVMHFILTESIPKPARPDPELLDLLTLDLTVASSLSAPPVIVRLAGLPAQELSPLTSPACIELLLARELLQKELGEARQVMVEALGNALPEFEISARRFLLTVKRSCFNGREIGTHRKRAEWVTLLRVTPNLTERIVDLEEQLRESDRAFAALHESELTRERRHVLDLVQDHRFLRGVALGRPGLVQKIRAQAPALTASGFLKKPAKWEQSLLRFMTRAVAKMSANSTLTAYALGSVQKSSSPSGFHFLDSPQREVSLVRVNRPEMEQFQALLMRHPAVREHALVAWNDSTTEPEPGQYRFLREGYWHLAPETEGFQFVRPARVTVRLPDTLFLTAAQDALRKGALRYQTLLALLESGDGIPEGETAGPLTRSYLDQLVDLGLLLLMPPWPDYEPRLELRIRQFLRALPNESTLRTTADLLDELLALENGFVSASRPESSVAAMEAVFSRLLDTVTYLADYERPLTAPAHFFEDVLFESRGSSGDDPGTLQIAPTLVQEILRHADLVLRFAGLFNLRHDVLHTLAEWWRANEPGRREAPFLEIARAFAPLWKQFIHFHKTANRSVLESFDPLLTTAVKTLRQRRETLISDYQDLLGSLSRRELIPPRQLAHLVDSLPHRYAPLLGGPCVFVQPVDAEGSSWVLNHLHEGTGRYLSRVTPILQGPSQQRFLDHLTARSIVAVAGEEADLLEVMHPWGNLVNAHLPQAAKVLEVRGLHLGLPQERKVRLEDITIQADLDSDTFRLIDTSGRRVIPINLSTLADVWHPNLLRLLLAFGPGETRGFLPFAHSEGDDNFRSFSRLSCGNLVLQRRRWAIAIDGLRSALQELSDLKSYAYVFDWRRRFGLPAAGFYSERTHQGKLKPQYIDFDSPSLCGLFVSSIRRMEEGHLILEEALPAPANFPLDSEGKSRGFELLIDSLAVRTLGGSTFVREDRELPQRE